MYVYHQDSKYLQEMWAGVVFEEDNLSLKFIICALLILETFHVISLKPFYCFFLFIETLKRLFWGSKLIESTFQL